MISCFDCTKFSDNCFQLNSKQSIVSEPFSITWPVPKFEEKKNRHCGSSLIHSFSLSIYMPVAFVQLRQIFYHHGCAVELCWLAQLRTTMLRHQDVDNATAGCPFRLTVFLELQRHLQWFLRLFINPDSSILTKCTASALGCRWSSSLLCIFSNSSRVRLSGYCSTKWSNLKMVLGPEEIFCFFKEVRVTIFLPTKAFPVPVENTQ